MLELEASLASRLHEHEEQLRKHRLLVEKQREWLVEYVPSPAHHHETPATSAVASKDSRPTAEGSKKIPIEERLLQKGDESRRKLESEREKMEKERLENENRILGERVVSASITPRRTAESSRALWQGMPVELTAKPQISLMSEKLAEVKRSKEGLSDVDISTSLLVRAARARGALLERETANASSPHPQITSKASALLRDGTAFERLYASRSEKISEPQEELRSLIEESLCSGVPVITAKAQALQRRAGHSVSDDLYDDADVHVSSACAEQQRRQRVQHQELMLSVRSSQRSYRSQVPNGFSCRNAR